MQRRGGSGQPVKGQSANRPKARNAPTAQVSAADSQEQFDRLTRERDEALEQLAATSEVLQVISSSPGELEPVFQAMLANAVRICEAKFGTLFRTEGDSVRCVAMHGVPKAFAEERRRVPVIRPAPTTTLARALATKRPVQIADVRRISRRTFRIHRRHTGKTRWRSDITRRPDADGRRTRRRYHYLPPRGPPIHRQADRTMVQNFADQAVIAIENTRLLNELRQRTDDLHHAPAADCDLGGAGVIR